MPFSTKQLSNILYIEDDEGLARLLQLRMERFGYKVDIATSGEDGIKKLRAGSYDILLVDNYLPGINGIDVLKTLGLTESDPPAIFLTSSGDERLAIEAIKANAADYLIKDAGQTYLELLPSVMTAAHTRVELTKQNKRQQDALRKYAADLSLSEQRLNMALEGTDTGVWDWNLKTGELFWTENLRRNYQLPDGVAPSVEYWMNLVHPEDKPMVQKAIKDHLEKKNKFYHCIFREKAPVGSGREWNWVLARGLAQVDENGEAYRVTGTSTDFTIHKKLEEQLEEAKNKAESANRTKTDFLATMSHEIRTPMNAIIGLADILGRTKLDEKQNEIIRTVQSSAATLLTLINDLLDISRIEANQVEIEKLPLNLCELVTETAAMFKADTEAKKINLEVDCSEITAMHFLGDKQRIRQILTNLCGNALKFTEKGKIKVSVKILNHKGDKYDLAIKVSDTGIGIHQDNLESIFEKFVQADQSITRRYGGTGLGLAISYALAEQMDGRIDVESEMGKGSSFTLFIPLSISKNTKSKDDSSPENKAETPTDEDAPNILLVEDYAPNIMVATLLLDSMNYKYVVANNGVEAVDKVTAAPGKFDIILMDIQMHAMDGFEATQIIRKLEKEKNWPRHIIIGLTAHALSGDRERCLNAGMDEYISKPINAGELESKIGKLLKRV